MQLDFSRLDRISGSQPPERGKLPLPETENTPPPEPEARPAETERGKDIINIHQIQEDHERAVKVYKDYQAAIRASSQIQTEITKGLRAGEDIAALFLKAVKAIALMTGNEVFYTVTERDLREVYGLGLLEKPGLEMELAAVMERKSKLEASYDRETDTETKQHIKWAYMEHCKRAAELMGLIKKENGGE